MIVLLTVLSCMIYISLSLIAANQECEDLYMKSNSIYNPDTLITFFILSPVLDPMNLDTHRNKLLRELFDNDCLVNERSPANILNQNYYYETFL